jgi:hypothetical protein
MPAFRRPHRPRRRTFLPFPADLSRYGRCAARSGVLGSTRLPSAPRAGAAPTAGRVFFRAASSGTISNRGETLGSSGGNGARSDGGCPPPPRTCEIVPSGAAPGSLSRLAGPEAKSGGDAISYTRSKTFLRRSLRGRRRACGGRKSVGPIRGAPSEPGLCRVHSGPREEFLLSSDSSRFGVQQIRTSSATLRFARANDLPSILRYRLKGHRFSHGLIDPDYRHPDPERRL